jgi:hypothetical protein
MRNWGSPAASAAVALVSVALVSIASVQAQSERPRPPAAAPPTQGECTPDSPRPPNETTGGRPLSERLAESKGVICPPTGIDPGLTVPPVGGGRMPVIPPPGTPGGDPGIQPR